MKKILVLLSLFISFNAFSSTQLVPGKQVLVDVANQDIVSLVLNTAHDDSGILPEVTLVKQWSGFECEHQATLLRKSSFNMRSWEIQMKWSPGADLSGCIVRISFPGMEDSLVEIFMNY